MEPLEWHKTRLQEAMKKAGYPTTKIRARGGRQYCLSFIAEDDPEAIQLQNPTIDLYIDNAYPSDKTAKNECFLNVWNYLGQPSKKQAERLASDLNRAGIGARVTLRQKNVVVAFEVDPDEFFVALRS